MAAAAKGKGANKGMGDFDEISKKLNDAADCKSLLKKHATPERVAKAKGKKTKFGGTIADCIRSGKNFDIEWNSVSHATHL
jgi:hypothetical protein